MDVGSEKLGPHFHQPSLAHHLTSSYIRDTDDVVHLRSVECQVSRPRGLPSPLLRPLPPAVDMDLRIDQIPMLPSGLVPHVVK